MKRGTECPYPQGAAVDMLLVEEEEHKKKLTEEDAVPVTILCRWTLL